MLLAWLVQKYGGTLTLYDVFGQIPAPAEVDGERAHDRYRSIVHEEGQSYYGNLPNLMERIRDELAVVCSLDRLRFVQGPYQDTLPNEACEPYDLVHVDCDWYESVKSVLAFLETHLTPRAILQIDDYSNWQGSRMAVDEAEWLQPHRRYLVGGPMVVDSGKTAH